MTFPFSPRSVGLLLGISALSPAVNHMTISAATLDDLLRQVLVKLIKRGTRVEATRGWNRELGGVALKLTNPRARLSHTAKKGKVFSGVGELTWYLAKSKDAKFVSYYIKDYEKDAEKDGTIHGAYGPRLFGLRGNNQIQNVLDLLRGKPTSRRAVVQLFDAADLDGDFKDIPCTCSLQFMARSNRLDLVTFMRSNDAYLGLPHDVFSFTMIQEILARSLGYDLGVYTHFVGSLHLYDENATNARKYIDEGWQATEHAAMPPMPTGEPWPSIDKLIRAEAAVRKGRNPAKHIQDLDPYWHDLVRLLQVYRHFLRNENREIMRIRKEMAHSIYSEYIHQKEKAKRTVPRSGQPELFSVDPGDAEDGTE